MDNIDRLNNIREQQFCEMPSSQEHMDKIRNNSPLPEIVSVVLIIVLIFTAIYASLHPIHKVLFKFFVFRNCTIEIDIQNTWIGSETKKVLIDGNLINLGGDYYEVDGNEVYKYIKTGKCTWERIPADEEEWTENSELGNTLLDKNNYKRVKGELFAWRLKNSVAETIDELSSITLRRDAGKIAIVGYYNGVKIAFLFALFGRTKIDPPWEEPGMNLKK